MNECISVVRAKFRAPHFGTVGTFGGDLAIVGVGAIAAIGANGWQFWQTGRHLCFWQSYLRAGL